MVFVSELASFYFAIYQYPHRKTERTIKHSAHSNGIMNGEYYQLCNNFISQAKKNPISAAKYLLYPNKFDFMQFHFLGSTLIASGCKNVSVEIDVERLIQHCFSDLPVKMFDQAKNKFQHFFLDSRLNTLKNNSYKLFCTPNSPVKFKVLEINSSSPTWLCSTPSLSKCSKPKMFLNIEIIWQTFIQHQIIQKMNSGIKQIKLVSCLSKAL